jgi:hypothetical protein
MTTLHGARDQQPDKEKLRQLALYVAHRSENDPRFGRVKFNKILFYCDFMHYLKTGRSITGYSYIKMEFGPCPEDFDILEKEMDKADELKLQTRERYGLIQKRPIALIEYDLKKFTGEEIATVEEVLQGLDGYNGKQVSELSHMFVGWELAKEFEHIPYSVARLGFDYPLNEFHYKWANTIAQRALVR